MDGICRKPEESGKRVGEKHLLGYTCCAVEFLPEIMVRIGPDKGDLIPVFAGKEHSYVFIFILYVTHLKLKKITCKASEMKEIF